MAFLRQTMFVLSILLLLGISTNAISIRAPKIPLPALSGKFEVGTIELKLTDTSRTDPFASNASTPRSILAQCFYPAKNTRKYPFAVYMGPATASFYEGLLQIPNGSFSSLQTNSHIGAPINCGPKPEVIIFSAGLGTSRKIHTVLAEDLASHGFIVITTDHPYEGEIVEFPDGTLIFSVIPENLTESAIKMFSDIRMNDTIFTLNSLKRITDKIPGMKRGLDFGNIGIFGHSLGGSIAADVMLADDRVIAGINMDGMMRGPAVEKGLDKPFLIMGAGDHYRTTYLTWQSFWDNQRGWKRELHLADSQHRTYTDAPAFVELLGLRELNREYVEEMVGTINGLRAVEVQKAYVSAFFRFGLRGSNESLLDGPDARYKEMSFLD